MKPLIAVDCDGVLADFATPFFAWYNKQYGTNFSPNDNLDDDLTKLYKIPWPQLLERVHAFFDEHLQELTPTTGSAEALRKLAAAHRLILITSRSPQFLRPTQAWLEKHYPGIFESVYVSHGTTKAAICKAQGAIIMIEDQANHIREFKDSGVRIIMFDQPWNRHFSFEPRVKNWEEALTHVR